MSVNVICLPIYEVMCIKIKSMLQLIVIVSLLSYEYSAAQRASDYCVNVDGISMTSFTANIIPKLEGKHKGDAGRICIIGGSTEYTGAPYFAAMSALRVGADLVFVITTETAAPVIKSYSPDLIVYPYLHDKFIPKIKNLLPKMDVVVIGPGLGRENETLSLVYEIIKTCKDWEMPLVIDADGLYAISNDISVIEQYPNPGVILTPNYLEARRLEENVQKVTNFTNWYSYWGDYVSVLLKGKEDIFHSTIPSFEWKIRGGGSGRRAGGQGDILSGFLGTFLNWTLKSNLCAMANTANYHSVQIAQSLAAYAAANLTRECNFQAYLLNGRSMTASDMLKEIHLSFELVMLQTLM